MCLRKNTILQRVPDLDIKLRSNTDVSLILKGESFLGDQHTLAILDVFSTPKTFEEGLGVLKSRVKGTQSWVEVTSQIVKLYECGVLKGPSQQNPILPSYPTGYDDSPIHIRMLYDRHRTLSYQEAIRETVTSADIVIDIGTGTGVLAATAAMAGAKHVYAIEISSMAKLAQRVFDVNGLSDRITLVEGKSTQIELPEKADVMVSEIIGNDPLAEGIRETTADAVKRLLKPEACLIPNALKIYGLPVSVPVEKLRECIFTQEAVRHWQKWYGIDFSPLSNVAEEQDHAMRINTYHTQNWLRLSDPILLIELDLEAPHYPDIQTSHQVQAQNSGSLTGILIYFELKLGRTVQFSIHPQRATPDNHWKTKLWIPGKPVSLEAGDVFELNYSFGKSGSMFKVQKNSSPDA